jgi:hypothetical protein
MKVTTLVMMKVMMGVANWISPIHFGGECQNCRNIRNASIIRIHSTKIPGTPFSAAVLSAVINFVNLVLIATYPFLYSSISLQGDNISL